MTEKKVKISNIAGLCVKGGRKDNFFLCLLEYFEDSDRWFLSSTLQLKGEMGVDKEDSIQNWLNKYKIDKLIVNFPLSYPACKECTLDCPGIKLCPDLSVKEVQLRIDTVLKIDSKLHDEHPKTYENNRILDDQKSFRKDLVKKNPDEVQLISRPLRRRLKKGFLPYWNRSLDFWIWSKYFDQMHSFFKSSFDSFGNTSLMVLSRFSYMLRQFPKKLKIYEANAQVNLIELYMAEIITKDHIKDLQDIHAAYDARVDILKNIEKKLGIFIYNNDLDLIADHPLAFEAFLLGVVGTNIINGNYEKLPSWTLPVKSRFIVPKFL